MTCPSLNQWAYQGRGIEWRGWYSHKRASRDPSHQGAASAFSQHIDMLWKQPEKAAAYKQIICRESDPIIIIICLIPWAKMWKKWVMGHYQRFQVKPRWDLPLLLELLRSSDARCEWPLSRLGRDLKTALSMADSWCRRDACLLWISGKARSNPFPSLAFQDAHQVTLPSLQSHMRSNCQVRHKSSNPHFTSLRSPHFFPNHTLPLFTVSPRQRLPAKLSLLLWSIRLTWNLITASCGWIFTWVHILRTGLRALFTISSWNCAMEGYSLRRNLLTTNFSIS